jgi:hypothetical protein
MADLQMVNSKDAERLGLSSTLVTREEWEGAKGQENQGAVVAAAADAVLFEGGPQEAQEGASEPLDVSVEAGVARKPRRARKPAPGDDAGQFVADDPATPDVNEAYEPVEA